MKQIIKEELTEALQDQNTAITDTVVQSLRSGAVTPAPAAAGPASPDPAVLQARIMTLLQQGQLNEAFKMVNLSWVSLILSLSLSRSFFFFFCT